jgi:glutaminase
MRTNWQTLLNEIHRDAQVAFGQGRVASYIPALANVNPRLFGISIATVEGEQACAGDAHTLFSIQSVSKIFTLALALRDIGESLWEHVGREPSGNKFNSLIQLEHEHGVPRNPFINAGALAVADQLTAHSANARGKLLRFMSDLCGRAVQFDYAVAKSEAQTGHRNAALAHFMKSFGVLDGQVADVLDAYFHQCAIAMSAAELARASLFLANRGVQPSTGEVIVSPLQTRRINALMLTCGLYDAVGEFAYQVGLPAKSGVGGGIVAVVPGKLTIAVFSPELEASGNSCVGVEALKLFVERTGLSVF